MADSKLSSKRTFSSILQICDFLEKMRFSETAILEVVKRCYFTRRESRIFEYFPYYLQGYRQAEIGFFANMSQPTVSCTLKRCITKIRSFKKLLSPDMSYHIASIRQVCTPKACDVLFKALAGIRFRSLARQYKCTVFNISLICKYALRKLKKHNLPTYEWAISVLKFCNIVRRE